MQRFNSKLVITGDLNIHLEDDLDPHCIQFNRLLESCALKQHVNSPTHEKGGWLDVIITRTDSNVIDLHVEPPTLSDHGLIYCTVPTACPASPVFVTRQVRGWSRLDLDAFRAALRSGPLCHDDEFYKEMKVTELFDLYNSTLRDLLDNFLPLHKVKSRYQPSTPWFDADCRRIKRQVRLLERRYRLSKSDVDRLAWVNASRDKQSTFREKENSYWEGRIAADASNPRKLRKSLSALLGRREQTKSTAPSSFTATDYLLFIEEKVDAVRRDTEGSQPPTFDPVDCSLLSFKQCSMEDLSLIISSSAAKSCSLDPVPTSLVKENLEVLLPFLNRLCNASINEGCLPPSQKEAIVPPVLKKHGLDSSDMKNFRPVSNLSFMSKIVEKVVAKQLTEYLNCNIINLLPRLQSGFRRFHSTETAVLKVLSDVHSASDQGQVALLALLDVSAAFDTVDHTILLDRLSISYGISGTVHAWISSFVCGRSQTVHFGGTTSSSSKVRYGIPQGSTLGPTFVCPLYCRRCQTCRATRIQRVHLYADDTQLYGYSSSSGSVTLAMNILSAIDSVKSWMSSNRLRLNYDKTQFIWFGTRQQLSKRDIHQFQAVSESVDIRWLCQELGSARRSRTKVPWTFLEVKPELLLSIASYAFYPSFCVSGGDVNSGTCIHQ